MNSTDVNKGEYNRQNSLRLMIYDFMIYTLLVYQMQLSVIKILKKYIYISCMFFCLYCTFMFISYLGIVA